MAGWDVRFNAVGHPVTYRPITFKANHIVKINNSERFARLPDAFLFDTDNTLYPYDPAHAAAQKAVRDKVIATFSVLPADFDNTENDDAATACLANGLLHGLGESKSAGHSLVGWGDHQYRIFAFSLGG